MPGRICAMEVMIATPAIRNLVREAKSHQLASIIQTSAQVGMQTMDQHLRDLETMQNAIRAAETGHLVFATLHTNSAAQTVDRVVDQFPVDQQEQVRLMLSNSLEAVLCQQLLPRAGMPGRVCAMEVMIATPAIRNLIREAKSHQLASIIQTSAQNGMQTMDQDLRDLYLKGIITYDDAMARAMNLDELKNMINASMSGGPGNGTPRR